MIAGAQPPGEKGPGNTSALAASLSALSWLNFLTALMQTAFGAFLAVYLTTHGWTRTQVGFALSAGAAASLLSQVPGGMLVDWMHSKRLAAGGAVLALGGAGLLIAALPWRGPVYAAQLLQGAAAAVLTPAIAALTLALAHQERLGERLGHNVRFAALGSALAAVLTGLVGAWVSQQAMFWLAAACAPASLLALASIRAADLESAPQRAAHPSGLLPRHRTAPPARMLRLARDPRLQIFAVCMLLFQLGNAALLPTAAAALTRALEGHRELPFSALWPALGSLPIGGAALLVAGWVVVPQILAALLSPWLGRVTHRQGRRHVLLAGFAMMPLRALLFAAWGSPAASVLYQALDGISAAAFGVLVPLVVADVTRSHGRFNLAIGMVGLATAAGGALSTALAGALADLVGARGTFLALGAVGLIGLAATGLLMPETHPARPAKPAVR